MLGGTVFCCLGAALALLTWPLAAQGGAGGSVPVNTAATFVAQQLAAGRKPNRLIDEKSPYLLQHAFNPVHWLPWGEEAFARAREENKPIFLSIGYSTCHWCHVMGHESFEDPAIAALLNRDFVCIKVDREERPDLDRVYMAVTQTMTGSGGWPMSVFLTPELTPFFAGTYFPPRGGHGRPGFGDLLTEIAKAWQRDHAAIKGQAAAIVEALREEGLPQPGDRAVTVGDGHAATAAAQLGRGYDKDHGGFGVAPKFPRPVALGFLLRHGQRGGDQAACDMVYATLRQMAAGGLFDQLGGGFHRYSVDAQWRVPHFEKMLYDQAQLAVLYLEAYQLGRDADFAQVAARTVDYALSVLRDPGGGFYSAEDADSPDTAEPGRQREGAYYLWREGEVRQLLGATEADYLSFRFGVRPQGNAIADPQGEFRGQNVLHQAHSLAETARRFAVDEVQAQAILQRGLAGLAAAREKRPRPHCDDKILASWNGLMLSALAKAGVVLRQERYLRAAEECALFVRQRMLSSDSGRLWHRYRAGEAGITGQLDDYAFVVQGLLDLYEASFDWQWLELARELTRTQIALFTDQVRGGFFESTAQDSSVIMRLKADYDGAEPSGNSVAALNLLRLGRMMNDAEFLAAAEKTFSALAPQVERSPASLPHLLSAYEFKRQKPLQIVLAGERGAPDTRALRQVVAECFLPHKVMLLSDGPSPPPTLAPHLTSLAYMTRQEGKATAYLCENFACQQPTTDPQRLRQMLAK